MRILIVVLSIYMAPFIMNGQVQSFHGKIGFGYLLTQGSSGPTMELSYDYAIGSKSTVSLKYESSFFTGRGILPKDNVRGDNYFILDRTSDMPSTVPIDLPIQLSSHPDKHSISEMGLAYAYSFTRSSGKFQASLGALISRHKSSEIVEFLEGELRDFGTSRPFAEGFIPIFQYEDFLDIGAELGIEYRKTFTSEVFIGGRLDYKTYFKFDVHVFGTGFLIGFNF